MWRNLQAHVEGYIYDIRSEGDFKEHRLPGPPARPVKSFADQPPGVDFGQSQILRRRHGWAPYRVRNACMQAKHKLRTYRVQSDGSDLIVSHLSCKHTKAETGSGVKSHMAAYRADKV